MEKSKLNKKEKKKLEKLKAKLNANIVSPRCYNYLVLKEKEGEGKIVIDGEIGTIEEAIIDLTFDRFVKANDLEKIKQPIYEEDVFTAYEFNRFAEKQNSKIEKCNNEESREYNCNIPLTSPEIRKTLGLPRLTDKDISEAIRKLSRAGIEAKDVKIWAGQDNGQPCYTSKITLFMHILRAYVEEDTDQIAPRTKDIQHRFVLKVEDQAFLLFNNDAIRRRFSLFPANEKRNFYRLPANCQRLYRYLSLWNETHLALKQIADILNWKNISSNPTIYKKRTERILARLKKEGFIAGWEKRKNTRGMNTLYDIWGINALRGLKTDTKKQLVTTA